VHSVPINRSWLFDDWNHPYHKYNYEGADEASRLPAFEM
jgi:hypothetical protein